MSTGGGGGGGLSAGGLDKKSIAASYAGAGAGSGDDPLGKFATDLASK